MYTTWKNFLCFLPLIKSVECIFHSRFTYLTVLNRKNYFFIEPKFFAPLEKTFYASLVVLSFHFTTLGHFVWTCVPFATFSSISRSFCLRGTEYFLSFFYVCVIFLNFERCWFFFGEMFKMRKTFLIRRIYLPAEIFSPAIFFSIIEKLKWVLLGVAE